MERNIPITFLSSEGEIVFNTVNGDGTPVGTDGHPGSLAGLDNVVAPFELPDGNGYHITFIGGNDGAAIRNPVTNKPHTHGAIPHRFRRSGKVIHVEGLVIASRPRYRAILDEGLRSVLDASLQAGVFGQPSDNLGQLLWKPAGAATRYHNVHLYESLTIEGSGTSPKTFVFSLFAEHPEARTYTLDTISLEGGGTAIVPNDGNTHTWPIIRVSATGPFTLSNGVYQLKWGKSFDGDTVPILGDYIEIDMFRQTMNWNATGPNALPRLFLASSDFWSIPVGGSTVSCEFDTTILSSDAWVG